jgi:hypothetical protein
MKWGEFQSIWQLGAALNVAFYSFSQIRAPESLYWNRKSTFANARE